MATIISQLNSTAVTMMMSCKRHDKVFAFPSRQVTSINFPSSFKFINHINYTYQFCSRRLSTVQSHPITPTLPSTSSSLQENYCNNDGDLFAAEKLMMTKPSVGILTDPPSSRNFVDMMSRILASLLTYGVVFTFVTMAACLYTSNSALAASYGRIGGSSSSSSSNRSSSSSFSYGQSSVPYYWCSGVNYSDEDDSSVTHTCTCDTNCVQCISCNIREKGYKEEIEQDKNSCSCNCHSTCFFHEKIDHTHAYFTLAFIILLSIATIDGEIEKLDCNGPEGTMLIFQAGVSDKRRMLQRNINNIAENADTSTLNGLNCVLKEVVRALQHDYSSLHYCYLSVNYQSMESLSQSFQEILNRLLQGYDRDNNTLGNVDGVKYKKQTEMVKASSSVDNEYTMATIMVLATGQHSIPTKKEKGKTYVDSLAVLKTLQRIPKNNIRSVEVLWSPQKEDEVLLEEEIRRYTTMIRIENGHISFI